VISFLIWSDEPNSNQGNSILIAYPVPDLQSTFPNRDFDLPVLSLSASVSVIATLLSFYAGLSVAITPTMTKIFVAS